MSSGYSGGGDFYSTTGFGGVFGGVGGGTGTDRSSSSSSILNNNINNNVLQQFPYRSPASQISNDYIPQSQSQPMIPSRRIDFIPKRPLSEHQQAVLLRSVKQRSQYNHTSPISPLSPFDFSSLPNNPLLQQFRSLPVNGNNGGGGGGGSFNLNPNPILPVRDDSEKKMMNRLQELEKQLLDDNDDGDFSGDVSASTVTTSEWSETILLSPNQQNQNPIPSKSSNQNQNPNPFSPSPTSSSCSSSSPSASSSSFILSSKQSLTDVANAISEGKIDIAASNLQRLQQISNFRGDPEQRLTAYMVSALKSKVNPVDNPPPVMDLCNSEHIMATQKLYEASPCFKLAFMAANLAILESLKDHPNKNVHIVDFDIGHGIQYVSLIHALGEKEKLSEAQTVLKITTVTDTVKEDDVKLVGDQLKKLADRVGVVFKFNIVSQNISELNRESLCCKANEALVVNFAFKLYKMPDESVCLENPRDELLRLVKRLAPRIVTVIEQEMNCNTAPFVARVGELSSYYLALFNSLDSTTSRDGLDRVKIEECLGKKMVNSVACEGRDRVERCEVFGKWRARMGMAGFVSRPLSQPITDLIRARLSAGCKNNNPGFTVKDEAGGICFGWMGRAITVVSAWR